MLAGDSAGGNLALVTLHRARAAGEPLPACAVLLSPAVDCTMGSPSMVAFDGQDPMIRLASLLVLRRHYVPSPHLYTNPEVSPLFADFEGLPAAVLPGRQHRIAAGRSDPRPPRRRTRPGVDVELELWPGAAHVFQIAGFLPEAALAIDHIARFVRMRTGWQDIVA